MRLYDRSVEPRTCPRRPQRLARSPRPLSPLLPVALLALVFSCANPYTPASGADAVAVYAVADYFHARILVQEAAGEGGYEYTLYAFGDREWYAGGEMNAWTGTKAVFVGSDAVLSIGRATSSLGPKEVLEGVGFASDPDGWRFMLARTELERARSYLAADILADPAPELQTQTSGRFTVTFYPARQPYTGLYSCIHFVADFLNQAGVDFRPLWYHYTNALLRDRLNRLTDQVF